MASGLAAQPAYVLWLVALVVCSLISLAAGVGAEYRGSQRAVGYFAFAFVVCLGAAVVVFIVMLWGTP